MSSFTTSSSLTSLFPGQCCDVLISMYTPFSTGSKNEHSDKDESSDNDKKEAEAYDAANAQHHLVFRWPEVGVKRRITPRSREMHAQMFFKLEINNCMARDIRKFI